MVTPWSTAPISVRKRHKGPVGLSRAEGSLGSVKRRASGRAVHEANRRAIGTLFALEGRRVPFRRRVDCFEGRSGSAGLGVRLRVGRLCVAAASCLRVHPAGTRGPRHHRPPTWLRHRTRGEGAPRSARPASSYAPGARPRGQISTSRGARVTVVDAVIALLPRPRIPSPQIGRGIGCRRRRTR